jgi:hypothetical protein
MKYFLATLTLLSMALSNSAFAVEKQKKNSFSDKDFKYSSQYKRSNKTLNKKTKQVKSRSDGNQGSRHPNGSEKKSVDRPHVSH